ncbi:MAG TPA: transposase, partial [Actinomycetes bacterium]
VASLAKRWLLGTHQGAIDDAHLPAYLDEFVFRFNRRTSRSRGLLFYRRPSRRSGQPRWLRAPAVPRFSGSCPGGR